MLSHGGEEIIQVFDQFYSFLNFSSFMNKIEKNKLKNSKMKIFIATRAQGLATHFCTVFNFL
jgi:hypothetical protein